MNVNRQDSQIQSNSKLELINEAYNVNVALDVLSMVETMASGEACGVRWCAQADLSLSVSVCVCV